MSDEVVEVNDGGVEPSGLTGRYLVLFREDATPEAMEKVAGASGLRMAHSSDFSAAASIGVESTFDEADGIVLDELKVAIVSAPPQQVGFLSARGDTDQAILSVEPERYVYAMEGLQQQTFPSPRTQASEAPGEYARGFRDASSYLYDKLFTGAAEATAEEIGVQAVRWVETAANTWGVIATRADRSRFTGRGVRVAILDTGFEFNHPDFAGRPIQSASFITGETAQDGHGHGTHCTGTACGPARPVRTTRRYGVATAADIYIGKVLSNGGSGGDSGILAGIEWAIRNRCRVVSMSLGARVSRGQSFSPTYEAVAQRAFLQNTLIIAAAGNDSARPGRVDPVSHPANCPSILAVAAIDSSARIAPFSNGGINPNGGEVNISGPGVAVFSSTKLPQMYSTLSGTSMATPHAAGVAALLAEQNPARTALQIFQQLKAQALTLPIPRVDAGFGLVQAP
jgi:subtilisin family serine protease